VGKSKSDKEKRIILSYLYITAATIGFSLNGPFGNMLDLPSGIIAWGRGLFASVALFLFLIMKGERLFLFHDRMDPAKMALLGSFLCGNWYFFYASVKSSSVAIAVVSLFTYPFITSIIEPIVFKESTRVSNVIGALLVLIGINYISPGLNLSSSASQGIILGILSGFCFSMRNILSRKLLHGYSSREMSLYQFMVAGVVFSPFLLIGDISFTFQSFLILFVFGAVVTTLSLVLFTNSLNVITASFASILLSTQPIITVFLNYLLVGDVPSSETVVGGLIITAAAMGVSLVHYFRE
jgi:drug/metabolite transporter (DMT)-like permease